MGDCIGGKPGNTALRVKHGRADYTKIALSEKFQQGIDRLIKGINDGWRIGLLCAEENTTNCHRQWLIAREVEAKRSVAVLHICANGHLLPARRKLLQE